MIKQDIIHSDDYWYHLSRLQDAQENKHSIQYKKKFYIWNTTSPINLLQPLLIFRVVNEYNQN